MYPYGPRWWRHPLWWTLPRAHTRFPYFKREFLPETYRNRCFRLLPAGSASRLPILRGIRPISYAIPAEKIVTAPPDEVADVRDPHRRRGSGPNRSGEPSSGYPFTSEEEYYADLQRSRFAITTKRAGWDCLRHYEIAANGAVPCFRDLDAKPSSCAPHGLNGTNCIDLQLLRGPALADRPVSAKQYDTLQHGAIDWARQNSPRWSAPSRSSIGAGCVGPDTTAKNSAASRDATVIPRRAAAKRTLSAPQPVPSRPSPSHRFGRVVSGERQRYPSAGLARNRAPAVPRSLGKGHLPAPTRRGTLRARRSLGAAPASNIAAHALVGVIAINPKQANRPLPAGRDHL